MSMLNGLFLHSRKNRPPAVQSKQRDCGLTYLQYVTYEGWCVIESSGRACGRGVPHYPPGRAGPRRAPRLRRLSALARQERGARETQWSHHDRDCSDRLKMGSTPSPAALCLRRARPITQGKGASGGSHSSGFEAAAAGQVEDRLAVPFDWLPRQLLCKDVGWVRVTGDVAHHDDTSAAQLAHFQNAHAKSYILCSIDGAH